MGATQTRKSLTADIDVAAVVEKAAAFGFRLASAAELEAGVALAESLVDSRIATPESISRMNRITGITAWVTGDPVEGIFLVLPLTPEGELAVRDGTYRPADPDAAHLARQGKNVAAFYVGIYAGATHQARKNIMMASAMMRVEMFGAFPAYARAATEDGRRSMVSLGFRKFHGGLPDLYMQPAFRSLEDEAA